MAQLCMGKKSIERTYTSSTELPFTATLFSAFSTEKYFQLCFRGIPYVAKDRQLRMEAIGNFLVGNNNYDVISFQEVWTETDYQLIQKLVENHLPFSHYFYRYVCVRSYL